MSTPALAAPPAVLSFAASDPTSGAGLQADLLTLAALGCHPLSVVTALTAQDTSGVARFLPIESAWIAEQASRVLDDISVAAFKAGVLGSAANVRAVAEIVAAHADAPFVVDPARARSPIMAANTSLLPAATRREARW